MNVERTVTIPAAINGKDGVYTEAAAWARFFICISASAPFKVQFGQLQPFDCSVGVSRDAGPDGAGQLVLCNTSATAITVTFILSDGEHLTPNNSLTTALTADVLVPDPNTQGATPPTVASWATDTFAGGATYTYPGTRTINGVTRQRKYIYICNRQGAGTGDDVGVEDTALTPGNHLAIVGPGQNVRLDLSATLLLRNLRAGTAIRVNVFEIF